MRWNRLAIGAVCVVVLVLPSPRLRREPCRDRSHASRRRSPRLPRIRSAAARRKARCWGFSTPLETAERVGGPVPEHADGRPVPPRISHTSCGWCSTPGYRRDWHR